MVPESTAVPLVPCVRMESRRIVSPTSISVSLAKRSEMTSVVSSVPVAVSCHADGASFTGRIVTVTVSEAEVKTPSVTRKVKLSEPLILAFGV